MSVIKTTGVSYTLEIRLKEKLTQKEKKQILKAVKTIVRKKRVNYVPSLKMTAEPTRITFFYKKP